MVDEKLGTETVLGCSCWMRTRFEIHEQVWLRGQMRKLDKVETLYELLIAIEDIYTERLRGRPGSAAQFKDLGDEMMLNLPYLLIF